MNDAPTTDHDLLLRVWTLLEGSNGSGLIPRFGVLEKDVQEIKSLLPTLCTHEEQEEAIQEIEKKIDTRSERRKMSARDWTMISVTLVGPILAVAISLYLNKGMP